MNTTINLSSIVRADQVIGTKVVNSKNEKLGKIYQIVLNKFSGNVNYVVLESGSFLGVGGKLIALPWKAFSYSEDEQAFFLNLNEKLLDAAPGFDIDNWPSFSDPIWEEHVAHYYSKITI